MAAINIFRPKLSISSHQTNVFRPCNLSRFPLTPLSLSTNVFPAYKSFPRKHGNFVPLKVARNTLECEFQENNRKISKLAPSEWGHRFISAHVDLSEMESLEREIEALKPKVWDIFIASKGMKEKILLIYLLVSLGLACHFEDAIKEIVKDGFQKIEEMMEGEDDLFTVSIIFYVFRTYGHNISSDVFKRFKGDNEEFKECLSRDAKGILSLYEAANMGTTTDYILDEALSFTLSYLEPLASSGTCKPNLSRLIRNALDLPQHKNVELFVAKEYIMFYEQEDDCDKTIVKFAKLNLKFLHLLYLQEVKILSKWYKEQDFESKLPPYYRDRIVECHLLALGYMDAKYSKLRIFLSKLYKLEIIVDDTCDRYASLPEIEILNNSIERWDRNYHVNDELPDYLKYVIKFIFDTFDEFEKEMESGFEGSYSLAATIENFQRYVRSNFEFNRWAKARHVPSFDEYLDVALIEIAMNVTLTSLLMMVVENICKKDAYEWLETREKLLKAVSIKTRLLNDLHGIEDDKSNGCVTGSINCYKKQYGVNEEEAVRELKKMVVNCDKIMNEEYLKPINVPRQVLKIVIDLVRGMNVAYLHDDTFTRLTRSYKNHIKSIYVDLI